MSTDSTTTPTPGAPDVTDPSILDTLAAEPTSPPDTAPRQDDEATVRCREGLPGDALILATYFPTSPPMRMPDYAWAMLVLAADMATADHPSAHGDDDPASRVHLFAGGWIITRLDPTTNIGDVILRLHPPAPTPYTDPDRVDIDIMLAQQGRWDRVGTWHGLDTDWPRIVAPTAHLSMRLHADVDQFDPAPTATRDTFVPKTVTYMRRASTSVAALLSAGLLSVGEKLVWDRRNHGVCHAAIVCANGALQLADGSIHATPSGAITALGTPHVSGWQHWHRARDNRSLYELRTELQAQQRR